jgi:hypothetical protein
LLTKLSTNRFGRRNSSSYRRCDGRWRKNRLQPPPNQILLESNAGGLRLIILFETSLELLLAIPGWEQTSIAEAFLSRTGRSMGFLSMRRSEYP